MACDPNVCSKTVWSFLRFFARAQSTVFFNRLKVVFPIDSKDDLLTLKEAFKSEKLLLPEWHHQAIDPFALIGYDELTSLP